MLRTEGGGLVTSRAFVMAERRSKMNSVKTKNDRNDGNALNEHDGGERKRARDNTDRAPPHFLSPSTTTDRRASEKS